MPRSLTLNSAAIACRPPFLVCRSLAAALHQERHARWCESYQKAAPELDKLSAEFIQVYQDYTTRLIDLFQRMQQFDARARHINSVASDIEGEHHRLPTVEWHPGAHAPTVEHPVRRS
jgi:hypothetical protein